MTFWNEFKNTIKDVWTNERGFCIALILICISLHVVDKILEIVIMMG